MWIFSDASWMMFYHLELDQICYGAICIAENDDDNAVLGFGGENVSLFQKITVIDGLEQKEIAPQHIILCLTGEGKLIIYYLASSYLPVPDPDLELLLLVLLVTPVAAHPCPRQIDLAANPNREVFWCSPLRRNGGRCYA